MMLRKVPSVLVISGLLSCVVAKIVCTTNLIYLSQVQASFVGEKKGDWLGHAISVVGDVNGDGYDDVLIGAPYNDDGAEISGISYLVFGETSGWQIRDSISCADASFIGEGDYNWSGYSVSGAGDMNGDGLADFLIGAYGYSRRDKPVVGQTYLILGKVAGWQIGTDLSKADASFIGEHKNDYSGSSVAGGGDVNGDGFDDILIGAPFDDDGCQDCGQVYLILGKATGFNMRMRLSTAAASFLGGSFGKGERDVAGWAVSIVGDVNGDDYDDILIGGVRTFLIFGRPDGWRMRTPLTEADVMFIQETDSHGSLQSGVGDVNGDGYDDICIGNVRQIYLLLGKPDSWQREMSLSEADASFMEETPGEEAFFSVSGGGDVNGDGFADILIGAPWNNSAGYEVGQTYLVLGKPDGWKMRTPLREADFSFLGEAPGDQSGFSVSNSGDVNGDGYDDILVGARWYGPGDYWESPGLVYLCFYPQLLFIATENLPYGALGYAYSETLSGHGGTPPYRWELLAGTLPEGFTFDTTGVISGLPATTDSAVFTIQVTDSTSRYHRKEFTLVIGEPTKGDVNIDGRMNALDVMVTVNIMIGLVRPTPIQRWSADFNGDGSVNVLDVVQMIRSIL